MFSCIKVLYSCFLKMLIPEHQSILYSWFEQALDLVPKKIHERSPIFLGSYDDVEEIIALYAGEGTKAWSNKYRPASSKSWYAANLLLCCYEQFSHSMYRPQTVLLTIFYNSIRAIFLVWCLFFVPPLPLLLVFWFDNTGGHNFIVMFFTECWWCYGFSALNSSALIIMEWVIVSSNCTEWS